MPGVHPESSQQGHPRCENHLNCPAKIRKLGCLKMMDADYHFSVSNKNISYYAGDTYTISVCTNFTKKITWLHNLKNVISDDNRPLKLNGIQHAPEEGLRIFGSTNDVYDMAGLKPLRCLVAGIVMQEKEIQSYKDKIALGTCNIVSVIVFTTVKDKMNQLSLTSSGQPVESDRNQTLLVRISCFLLLRQGKRMNEWYGFQSQEG